MKGAWAQSFGPLQEAYGHLTGHLAGHLTGHLVGHLTGHLAGHLTGFCPEHGNTEAGMFLLNSVKIVQANKFIFCHGHFSQHLSAIFGLQGQ